MADRKEFAALDWVLFIAMLAVSAGIGIFYAIKDSIAKKSGDTSEFLMGGRKMAPGAVAISILVSFMSAIFILGTPAEMYTAGTLFVLSVFGLMLAIILTAWLFVPLLYPLKLTSGYEYLELRFKSRVAKLTGSIILIINQILYMGIATFAPSTALEAVTGFPTWASIVIVGCLSTFYTFLGGMKAVVWTDVFQSLVMIAGLLAVAVKGAMEVGGMKTVWETNEDWGRIEFWKPDLDPTVRHSTFSVVVGQTFFWLGAYGVSQASVQRYSAVASVRQSICVLLINLPGGAVLLLVTAVAGIVMFAYYAQAGCDPLTDGRVKNANQLLPLFVTEVVGIPGMSGLFVSCLFSGALSTMSSCLNALAAVTWEDILKPLIGERITESKKTWLMRCLVAAFGAAGIGFAFVAKNLGGTVFQASISFVGASGSALLGIFLLGGLFPWANWIGCIVGGISALTMSLWIGFGAYSLPRRGYTLDFPSQNCAVNTADNTLAMLNVGTTVTPVPEEITGIQQLYTVSYLWYPAIGALTAVIVGLIVSFITGPMHRDEIDPKYLIHLCDCSFFRKSGNPLGCCSVPGDRDGKKDIEDGEEGIAGKIDDDLNTHYYNDGDEPRNTPNMRSTPKVQKRIELVSFTPKRDDDGDRQLTKLHKQHA